MNTQNSKARKNKKKIVIDLKGQQFGACAIEKGVYMCK